MGAAQISSVERRSQQGWPARFVLVQFPNPPLLVALAGSLVAMLAGSGHTADYATAVSRLGLAAFAYLELTDGVNWFRRLLGAAVLIGLVITLSNAA